MGKTNEQQKSYFKIGNKFIEVPFDDETLDKWMDRVEKVSKVSGVVAMGCVVFLSGYVFGFGDGHTKGFSRGYLGGAASAYAHIVEKASEIVKSAK